VSEAAALVRAFSLYFSLTNLAEQTHRIRRRRDYAIEGTPQPGSLDAVFTAFDAGDRGLVVEALNRLRIMPVLTAHPTEAIRRTVLKKEQRIARALVDRIEKPQRTPIEDRRITERIRTEIGLIWETAEQASSRPTVADEVEHILFFLAEIVYRVVPAFHDALDAAAGPLAADHDPSVARAVLRFGSWVGGDMDGNPNVGADTILATLSRHRELILGEYRQEVRTLFEHLSQGETWGTISDEVRERARTYRDQFPEARVPERYADMPYRVLLWMIWHRLGVTLSQDPTDTPNPPSSRTT
jgi:phosphoenolpyruvate carboxylase